jgi:hypothetical protein
MKVIKNKQLFLFCYIIGLISCTDESSTPCNFQDTMLISSTASDPCLESGSIEIKEPVGTNFQYQIDNEPFQNNVLFSKVKVGKHVLVAKDENGCEVIKEVIVEVPVTNTVEKIIEVGKPNDKTKLLQETLQKLRKELSEKNSRIKELEEINKQMESVRTEQGAIFLKGSNIRETL